MRVTHRMIIDNAIRSMSESLQKLSDLQSQASSGKKFTQSSENPRASRSALALRSNLNANQSYLDTIHAADEWMTASQNALEDLNDLAMKGLNKALTGVSETNSESRSALAAELDTYLNAAVAAANTKYQDNYLFSGFQLKTKPFELVSGSPDTVTYAGDSGSIQRQIGPDQTMTVNFDADQVITPMFEALIAARDALQADDTTAIQTAVEDLRAAQQGINDQGADTGMLINQLEDSTIYLEETQTALEKLLSREEDIDLVEVISQLRHQETVYQTTLEIGHRTMATMNLFDLLK